MKIVLAAYGTRGDIEPSAAVGRELLRRGHDVHMAVPPDLIGFVETVGLPAVAYGPDLHTVVDSHRNFWARFFRSFWKIKEVTKLWHEAWEPRTRGWAEMSSTLTSLVDGSDLLIAGLVFEEVAANVAEHHRIPFATLHYFPIRANGQLLPALPSPLARSAMSLNEWLSWRVIKRVEDAQRRELGLTPANAPTARRISTYGSLEVQAYDEVWFPGLAAEWSERDGRRPLVGALTLELTTNADDEVASWMARGKPPIYFGFGSLPVESAAETVTMIGAACEQLGERALVCAGGTDFGHVPHMEHVKVVDAVNFAATLPACRAVVHHGGAGTTAAGLRAGLPTLILSTDLDQTLWGVQVKRRKVGFARRLSATSRESLVADLRRILAPEYAARAREMATQMSQPAASVSAAADLIESFVRIRHVG
ncbi:glycosyltransferase [Mycolicibacterium sp. ND9-15]|uniref:glycosyltransferase n=1 Tax=Mycolicibacterium sp. ND9-15 TaxID=3042320 RepID=UPI002DD98862|nr:glycosyltransferase [Mycolicibacterium sp. ND9-15]WSE58842.1 glycosyltransferase [Mycolicibacterium sp. ND9-15]